ncbi:nitrile hydratase subunit alpha [Sulfitobacter geojensis]|uniref:nitrile hydratase n=1 Tax=Sulfitobacter geojensis TaxID=1342299 RepID=A0AAE2W256_9RHOB|nr:nitrile hydratase subunit alpha [Sulfitobacter geojensis]MBM1691613.1 nitrile hydratase subunit alpha [Sulfitobacter geojensis]MBM1695679.1 nitrile hydratase subunit alpha [Sulfitobacter geojensis]MBM1707844.1 nitrile hydratase subunit alpha [Sulfitobacter geojensis]MBM1711903.1 nitrile hydratase subunit alpha [Sulfitobacter geojensis]MBM1715968.1 nitrile hydratase subunit alpha [Sulfitobacter geojensis]
MASFDTKKAAEIHRELHSHLPSEPALRVKALESLMVEKGLTTNEAINTWVEAYSEEIGPKRGAQVVARAWNDPAFKERLLSDAAKAIEEFGFEGNATGHLKVVENTAEVHNLVVCTLCSCYPFSILGIAPNWYKTAAYRSRAVRDPRGVLAEFGVSLAPDTQIHVWDSTAELRYLVLPQRPVGTERLGEDELAKRVTRNSMIGTDRDLCAQPAGQS